MYFVKNVTNMFHQVLYLLFPLLVAITVHSSLRHFIRRDTESIKHYIHNYSKQIFYNLLLTASTFHPPHWWIYFIFLQDIIFSLCVDFKQHILSHTKICLILTL